MRCPAVYPPDPTLGITDPQMLPPPKLVSRSRNYVHRPCPLCGKSCPRDRIFTRILHDLGDPVAGRPPPHPPPHSPPPRPPPPPPFPAHLSPPAPPPAPPPPPAGAPAPPL